MKSSKPLWRFGAVLVAVSAAIAAALVGGASTGHAATSFDITLAPLIGTSDVNVIPQVSYGGKIGYHLHVRNSGNSTTQHASILVTSNLATFSDSSDTTNCAVNPKDAHQMVCTPFGGTFVPGATFDVDLRFTAPATGPPTGQQVSTSGSISVAAQTVGGNKNNGTTLAQSCAGADQHRRERDKGRHVSPRERERGDGQPEHRSPAELQSADSCDLARQSLRCGAVDSRQRRHPNLPDLSTVVDVADDSGSVARDNSREPVLRRDDEPTRTDGQ